MSTEQDRVMAWLQERWGTVADLAESLVSAGFRIPEPQWKPGQYVIGMFNDMNDMLELFRRNADNTGWEDLNGNKAGTVDVTVVEPVILLNAENVLGVIDDLKVRVAQHSDVYSGTVARNLLSVIFAEQGVDV